MQSLKMILFTVLSVLVIVLLGWWAFRTLEPGDIHAERERIKELEAKNEELAAQVEDLQNQLAELAPPAPEESQEVGLEEPPMQTSKYQTLINELQALVNDKIYMKVGSRGTRVGTVQTFLNIYFGTNKRIDNDYGKGTKIDVANFQKAVGLPADGETGPATYQKMIDWLKSNS